MKVAAIQMISSADLNDNLATAERLIRQAAAEGAQLLLLPEYWPLMG
ncbi:nitrilase-related carbon-nitrogen hydrolase, partial [Undibacterium luofuense]